MLTDRSSELIVASHWLKQLSFHVAQQTPGYLTLVRDIVPEQLKFIVSSSSTNQVIFLKSNKEGTPLENSATAQLCYWFTDTWCKKKKSGTLSEQNYYKKRLGRSYLSLTRRQQIQIYTFGPLWLQWHDSKEAQNCRFSETQLHRLKQGLGVTVQTAAQILTIAPTNGILLSSLKNCFLIRDVKPERQESEVNLIWLNKLKTDSKHNTSTPTHDRLGISDAG